MEHKTCVFEQFESPCNIMTGDIINRIIANRFVFDFAFDWRGFFFCSLRLSTWFRLEYQARNDKKNKKELELIKASCVCLRLGFLKSFINLAYAPRSQYVEAEGGR